MIVSENHRVKSKRGGSWSCLIIGLIFAAVVQSESPPPRDTYQALYADLKSDPNRVLTVLKAQPPDAQYSTLEAAEYYYLLSNAYYGLVYPDKALKAAEKGLQVAQSQTTTALYQELLLAKALALDLQGFPKKGLALATAVLAWSTEAENQQLLIESLFVSGVLKTSLLDYFGSLSDLLQAYRLAPESSESGFSHTTLKGDIAASIALIYEYRGEASLALPYFNESVAFNRRQGYQVELSIALYGLGRANIGVGNESLGRQQLEESLAISQRVNDQQGVAYAIRALASLEIDKKNYERARALLDQVKPIFIQANNVFMLLDIARNRSEIELELGQTIQARVFLNQARQFLNPETMPLQQYSLDLLESKILAAEGSYQKAYQLTSKAEAKRRELREKESTERLYQLRTQYELDVKEKQNQLQKLSLLASQKEKKILYVALSSLAVVLILLSLMIYRSAQHKRRLEALASVDSLTGLSNRRIIMQLMEQQRDYCDRLDIRMAIAIIDLDHFKKINDTLGHSVGDKVLMAFAEQCRAMFRKTDHVGRIGGEEFIAIMPSTGLPGASKVLEQLKARVNGIASELGIERLEITFSAGLGVYSKDLSLDELLRSIDEALYRAKASGRNQVEVLVNDDSRSALSRDATLVRD